MKAIKSIVLLSFLLFGSLTYAQAQHEGSRRGRQGPPPIPSEEQIKNMVNDMADEISLSEDQETQVLELYLAHFEELEEKRSENSRPERSEMEAFRTDFQNDVKAILSESQKTQYEAYLREHKGRRSGRHSGR